MNDDRLQQCDPTAPAATVSDRATRVLKHDELFGVFDARGNIEYDGVRGPQGLYFEDTRHLSKLQWSIDGVTPVVLNSTVGRGDNLLRADLTNPDQDVAGHHVPAQRLHIRRETFLLDDALHECVCIHNFTDRWLEVPVSVAYASDFVDVFVVRGHCPPREDRADAITVGQMGERVVRFDYNGLAGIRRTTELRFSPTPDELDAARAGFRAGIEPHESFSLYATVACTSERRPDAVVAIDAGPEAFGCQRQKLRSRSAALRSGACRLTTSNALFDLWLERSFADIAMLLTSTEHGPYPYAGTPWFSTVFGRDAIITALEYLWVDASVARGVLAHLAALQATDADAEHEAEPGKVIHELRRGEASRTGEVPFGRYFGTVDATPLFVLLAGEYLATTGDTGFVVSLWDSLRAAVRWMDEYGDVDGDGYLEYQRHGRSGLLHQGWKDSDDAVFHADGSDPQAPIALCEVQAYAYGARRAIAAIAQLVGDDDYAEQQLELAGQLAEKFRRDFWLEDLGLYAIALDAQKRPCAIRASNAGHCLLTGIATRAHARRIADTLTGPDFYTGWGIRTLARGEARYNPMSYHNGSVWPHDNALIGRGLAREGWPDRAATILDDLFLAAVSFEHHRLPELFCGFDRDSEEQPTRYPVACAPQAWAAGAPFMLIQAALGLEVDGENGVVSFRQPTLPTSVDYIRLSGLRVGSAEVSLVVRRHPEDVGVEVVQRRGIVQVEVVK